MTDLRQTRVRRFVLCAAVVATAVISMWSPGVANAIPPQPEYKVATGPVAGYPTTCLPALLYSHDGAGAGCFRPDGDRLYVKDVSADGKSAGVLYWVGRAGSADYRKGVCRQASGLDEHLFVCNYDFVENSSITIQIGVCNQTADRSCRYQSQYSSLGDRYTAKT